MEERIPFIAPILGAGYNAPELGATASEMRQASAFAAHRPERIYMYACHNRLAALVAACTLIAGSLAPMPARTQSLDDEPHFYAGFGLSSGLYEVADLIEPFDAYRNDSELDVLSIDDARLSGLYGRFGYQIHPNVAIEGRLGVGSTGDSPAVAWITYDGGNTINFLILENLFELDLDNFVGVYGRFGGQVGSTYLYGMAGFSQVNVTAKLSGESTSESVGRWPFTGLRHRHPFFGFPHRHLRKTRLLLRQRRSLQRHQLQPHLELRTACREGPAPHANC